MDSKQNEILDGQEFQDKIDAGETIRIKKDGWKAIRVGDMFTIKGVPCQLTNINTGKKRLTFTPVGAEMMAAKDFPKG